MPRRRSDFIDEEEDEDEDYEDYAGGRGRSAGRHKAKKKAGSQFLDIEALVDSDEEEEEEETEDGFIVVRRADLPDEDGERRMHRRPNLSREEEQDDVENLVREIQARFTMRSRTEYDEGTTNVEQQALLPSMKDPRLYLVKCAIGHEREVAVCLMQKHIDKGSKSQIRSAFALDHLKNFIYIEADKESHVREAIKGMRNLFSGQEIKLVPIKVMTDILSAESKAIDISRNAWVRIKNGAQVDSFSRQVNFRNQPPIPPSPRRFSNDVGGRDGGRGGRGGHDSFIGKSIKIRSGSYKGCRGRVKNVKGDTVRVELECQMKVVTVERKAISDNVFSTTNRNDAPRYGMGSETPMHPSRTPLHPYMTPMRDPGATPIHDGMRTPMHDRAWNPYTPMSPNRSNWEDANPASWGTSPQYQPGSPPSRTYEAPTPGSGWANTPGSNYSDVGTPRDETSAYANAPSPYLPSTPGQPMTPNSGSYLPGTPGGQPMTPGTGGLDMMSPVIGGDNEGAWFMPDILVDVHKAGEHGVVGIIREVLPNGSCKVVIDSGGDNETITALPNEMTIVAPKKAEHIKIIGGEHRGATGKLIGIDGGDRIVKVDESLDVKILDASYVAVLAK